MTLRCAAVEERSPVDHYRTASDESAARDRLLASCLSSVGRHVRRRLRRSGIQRSDIDDLWSESVLECWRVRASLRDLRSIGAWATTVARRTIRRRMRDSEGVPGRSAQAEDPDQVAIRAPLPVQGVLNEILESCHALTPLMRRCVELRFEKGMSIREIASATRENRRRIEYCLSLAYGHLRDRLLHE